METVTKTGHGLSSALGASRRDLRIGVIAGAATLVPIVVADASMGGSALVTAYPVAAFVAAAFAVAPTAALWAITLVLGAISPLWNHNAGALDYWLRMGELLVAGGFAIFIAARRVRTEELSGRLTLLDEIGSTADGSLPLDETLRRALAGIVPGAADFCMVDTIRDEAVIRVAVRLRGRSDWQQIERVLRERAPSTPAWLRNPGFGIPPLPYFLPRVTRGHEEILSHDKRDLGFLRSLGLRSVVIAPMIARGRLLGTLTLGVAWSGRRYGPDDLSFTKALASRLGLALDHAGLFSDLESVERRMDAVMSKIPEAVTVHDANGTLVFANDVAAEWLGLASGEEVVARWRPGRVGLRLEDVYDESGAPISDRDPVAPRLTSGALPFRQLMRSVRRGDGRERWLVVSADAIRGPENEVLYAVTTLEDVTETKRSELGQRLIARTAELLAAAGDTRAMLRRVAELAVPDFADWCAVNLVSPDGGVERIALAHVDPELREVASELREREPLAVDDSRLATVIAAEHPLRYDVTEAELRRVAIDDEHLELLRRTERGSAISVPVRAGSRVVGAITFTNEPARRPFDDTDLGLAAEIGARAGMAIENARLSEMRKEIADALQEGLLPPELPQMDGWEVATMYKPAGELNEVGGDFYDAFEVENGWMIVVGDVVGRGAQAAALTALTRHTLNTACRISGDPRAALALLNARLQERSDQPLCSVAIVVLSTAGDGAAEAVVVSAGHPLPLLVRAPTAWRRPVAPGRCSARSPARSGASTWSSSSRATSSSSTPTGSQTPAPAARSSARSGYAMSSPERRILRPRSSESSRR